MLKSPTSEHNRHFTYKEVSHFTYKAHMSLWLMIFIIKEILKRVLYFAIVTSVRHEVTISSHFVPDEVTGNRGCDIKTTTNFT